MAPQFDRALRDLLRAAGCTLVRQGRGSHEIWHSPITKRNFAVPSAFRADTPPMLSCVRPDWQRVSAYSNGVSKGITNATFGQSKERFLL
jgi:hypothetical protein